jgi:hypothetical protein
MRRGRAQTKNYCTTSVSRQASSQNRPDEPVPKKELFDLPTRDPRYLIAFENYRARLNRVFDVESDGLYTPTVAIGPPRATSEKSPARGESSGAIAS